MIIYGVNMTNYQLPKITVRDIQASSIISEFGNLDGRIRKSWVLQMPVSVSAKLKAIPQKERFELYKDIDKMVRNEWVYTMKNRRESEPTHNVDTDEMMIQAARNIVTKLCAGEISLG